VVLLETGTSALSARCRVKAADGHCHPPVDTQYRNGLDFVEIFGRCRRNRIRHSRRNAF
jgi:hypothetical protein